MPTPLPRKIWVDGEKAWYFGKPVVTHRNCTRDGWVRLRDDQNNVQDGWHRTSVLVPR